MAVTFQELAGSPTESYGDKGFSATRRFLVAWSDRRQFVQELAGYGDVGGTGPLQYPGFPGVNIVDVKIEPFTDDVESQSLTSLITGLNSYSNAVVTVRYEYVSRADDNASDIELQEYTWLTHRRVARIEAYVHKTEHWRFTGGGGGADSGDSEHFFTQRIPVVEHHYTWHFVRRPPWTTINNYLGYANAADWHGYDAETILFDSYDAGISFIRLDDGTEPEALWTLSYLFREKRIQIPGGTVGGWNHNYDTTKGSRGWKKTFDENGEVAYQLTNFFDSLFQYIT
jgi:hypothetical protein